MIELGPHVPTRPTSANARTVGEMFWLRAARSATLPALVHKVDGAWTPIT